MSTLVGVKPDDTTTVRPTSGQFDHYSPRLQPKERSHGYCSRWIKSCDACCHSIRSSHSSAASLGHYCSNLALTDLESATLRKSFPRWSFASTAGGVRTVPGAKATAASVTIATRLVVVNGWCFTIWSLVGVRFRASVVYCSIATKEIASGSFDC